MRAGAVVSSPRDGLWCEEYGAVTEFGRYLISEDGLHGYDAQQLQDYYEKPWHWTVERDEWIARGRK